MAIGARTCKYIMVLLLMSMLSVMPNFSFPGILSTTVLAQEDTADTTPPEIFQTIPFDGQTDVRVSDAPTIIISFSEPMNTSTITTSTIVVSDGNENIDGEITIDDSFGFDAIFTAASDFQFSTTYTVTVSSEVKDLAGNSLGSNYVFSFTTEEEDTTPPEVIETFPADGATGISVYENIVAKFSEEIDFSDFGFGLEPSSFTLTDGNGSLVEGFTLHQGADPNLVSFDPSSDLQFSTTYTATIHSEGVKDLLGNQMESDYSWTFTTKSEKEAREKLLERVTYVNAHATWVQENSTGGSTVTDLDVRKNLNVEDAEISITLFRTVFDEEGNIVIDQFGNAIIEQQDVFEFSPNLRKGSLSPVDITLTSCEFLEGCNDEIVTIEATWTGTSKMNKFRDDFNQIAGIIDKDKIKFRTESLLRDGVATGLINGEDLGEPVDQRTFLSISDDVFVKYGDIDLGLGISITDYNAPIVESGNKTVRGGEGWVATANWAEENPDGSTTYTFLSVADGFGLAGRIIVFFNGTSVFLDRVTIDENGNVTKEEFGDIFTTDDVFDTSPKLGSASLSPTEIVICSFEDRDEFFNCIDGTNVTIEAQWNGIGEPSASRFRYNAFTNCDDEQCATIEEEKDVRVTVIGSGEFTAAVATGLLDGEPLGDSDAVFGQRGADLIRLERFTIQYHGDFPFEIFPIQNP
jgi:hypothetical protein